MSRTRAAVKSQPTPSTKSYDRGLVRRLGKLKIEAVAAEKKIASSHNALYGVLADCGDVPISVEIRVAGIAG